MSDVQPELRQAPVENFLTNRQRKRIQIRGTVQGVGFRPFVYQLAQEFHLAGFVLNTTDGVLIEAEGTDASLTGFLHALVNNPPPLAEVAGVSVSDVAARQENGFVIRESVEQDFEAVLVSPDVATCDECRREVLDPSNRRYGYPFTNCTNCGPRYSIIEGVPYDRTRTTMREFHMCQDCQAEYDDPANRRFHAQPNACPVCGPKLTLIDRNGNGIPVPANEPGKQVNDLDVIREVRRLLCEGKIVAIKGLGGFHLACDAENDEAVRQLRNRKRRSDKPFAVMAPDLRAVESFCLVSDEESKVLLSARHPIVVLPRRRGARISSAVAPGNNTLGVMLPYTPLHLLLFTDQTDASPAFTALVMTSGNLSEEPIVTSNEEALLRLGRVADALLLHNRRIYMRVDDSVVRVAGGKPRVMRRSRGYVPSVVNLAKPAAEILACGPELKNTFCLTQGRQAVLSQHIGDMENYETLLFFEETLANLKKIFLIEPRAVAYDLHPQYLTTRYALEQTGLPRIGVQHHHAHIASCMAENGLDGKVIGVAFDGTGYGTDGGIWGGEFLVADFERFERRAHLKYIPLAGGDAAVRQPWRAALAYLLATYGNELPDHLPLWKDVNAKEIAVVRRMIERGINTVAASSCGRLFDAVASILGLRHEVNFEGQAAIELEMVAQGGAEGVYPFQIDFGDPWQIDVRPVIESMVIDLAQGEPKGTIAARFHDTLSVMIAEVCRKLRESEHLNRVCLSGGTFQNMLLLNRTLSALTGNGFEVYAHQRVPPNDGGISLGQAVIADALLKRGA
jgi:hydrogenase maturation protein HypF